LIKTFMQKYILALDQGTTSSRAILFDEQGSIRATAQKEFSQIFPQAGWVEHEANEIWSSQAGVAAEVMASAGIKGGQVASIGITNQRETTILWNRQTGMPIHHAIVWQDRRTADYCDELKKSGHASMVKEKTGLFIDPYFSATKIKWMLDHVPNARKLSEAGHLAFGTVDSWLAWKFTNGRKHITDVSNASRTMLLNIKTLEWDEDLLRLFDIPRNILPEVCSSSQVYANISPGFFGTEVPLSGIAGDQQAALFGQACFEPGMVKNTYGTGCFIMVNAGQQPVPTDQMITTVAWKIGEQITYAIEGSIFIGGALVQWLRDGLQLFSKSADIEALAQTVPDAGGLYLVPAFAGLGSPHWDPYAQGLMIGITRGTTRGHVSRAALDAITFQVKEVIEGIQKSQVKLKELRVDGGASANNNLMQLQADVLGLRIIRPKITETTALGAAYLAGLSVGYWSGLDDIRRQWQTDRSFDPGPNQQKQQQSYKKWLKAVERSKSWLREIDNL
jgi:glycerol kinase